jgi:hypothetical protein
MTTPILSSADIYAIFHAPNEATADRVTYANILYSNLMDTARAVNLKTRFWEARYHGTSTRFVLTRIPYAAKLQNGTHILVEDVINEQSVLDRLEKGCGKYVQASYEMEQGGHSVVIYLEFVPPKSILNPEEEVTIPVSEELHARRLEKETSW